MSRGLFHYEGENAGEWWACVEHPDGTRTRLRQADYEAQNLQPYFEDLPLEADWNFNNSNPGSPAE